MSHASPLATRLVELLEGREWVERERLIREAGKVIPPGQAVRQAERIRLKAAAGRRATVPVRVVPVSDDQLIRQGRRALVVAALRAMRRRGNLEEKTVGDFTTSSVWVRLTALPRTVELDRRTP